MKKELFEQLAASLKEGRAILRGNKRAAHSKALNSPDAWAICKRLGLSQLAALIGISPRTLQNLEQSHRHPEGTALALLSVAECLADAGLAALHSSFVSERHHFIDSLL